ncbi:MAG: hypothetical protein SFZ02_19640 [bacterium]|nr:hypothetical protein [bacterium]
MDALIEQFWGAGLIQFGRFEDVPFKIQFELLPSYPDIWANLLDRLIPKADLTRYERLLAPADSVPLGTLLSYMANVPLVYSKGTSRDGVHDLLGAYDVGHPALFVANTWQQSHEVVIHKAQKVGLEIDVAWVLITYGKIDATNMTIHSLFKLEDVMIELHTAGKLPIGQVDAVLAWIG